MGEGYYKSREVYKYTETSDGRKLVPVRGLYVSGLHTEPWYIDHMVSVHDFTSSKGKIVDYTNITVNTEDDPIVHIVGAHVKYPTIQSYSTTEQTVQPDSIAHIVGAVAYQPTIVKYQTVVVNVEPDSIAHIVGCHFKKQTVIQNRLISIDMIPDHMISIAQYDTSTATITDVYS